MLWVNADLSSLEDKTKQCCIIDYDPEYVAELNVPGYDAHLAIGLRAGFFDEEDVKFYRYMKAIGDGKEPGPLPEKYLGRDKDFEELYGKMQDDRSRAKTTNYSATYGAGPPKIAESAECSLEEAKNLHSTYWEINWSVKAFAESRDTKEYEDTKYIWSPFTNLWLKFNSEHMRFSAINQNFGATVFDVWCYFLYERGVRGIFSAHDELNWYILDTEEAKERARQDVQWAIDQTNRVFNQPITFEAGPEFAKSYGDVH